ncbi:MAG: 3'(2'),5'-bisphosphate nucleotidase [Bacteroidetes bacterium]|nr:3'(2'),5'-bisphosphate nucleotidase [Bacteroidota bacterium]
MPFLSELQIALAAVREAAELCGEVQQQMDPGAIEKLDRSPVTIADFGSQALICSRLRRAFPDDPIIAEETSTSLRTVEGAETADRMVRHVRMLRPDASKEQVLDWIDLGNHKAHAPRYWTLDPIDGTKGFLRGDQYAVALALIVQGQVVVAAVACPNLCLEGHPDQRGVVAGAIKGQGTTLYRLQDMEPLGSASVTATADPAEARFSESVESAHTSHSQSALISRLLGITRPATRLDSQAKYVVVAAGDADIYLRLPSDRRYIENIWDHAAGMLLVEEAGGRVTDTRGEDLDFGHGFQLFHNRGILVTNGRLHSMMLKAIADIAPEEGE